MINEQSHKSKHSTCWKIRTTLEKNLIAAVAVFILITVILVLLIFLTGNRGEQGCLTPSCVRASAEVLNKIDQNIDPCDDFYKFTCGNFEKNTFLPEYTTSISSFSIVNDLVEEQLKTILGKPIGQDDARAFILVKSIYQACMNTTNIEANSVATLKKVIKNTGGWPTLEGYKWDERNFDWIDSSYKFMKVGLDYDGFFAFDVQTDTRNSSRKVLYLDQRWGMSFEKLLRKGFSESIIEAYYKYMVKFAEILGAPQDRAAKDMKEVLDLDIAIARITIPPEQRRNASAETNPMTVLKLQSEFNYVPWLEFINEMLHPVTKMTYDDHVIVTVPEYFKNLGGIIKSSKKRTLANFMYWKAMKRLVKYLSDDVRNLKLEFSKSASGNSERGPKWKECMDEASGLYAATGALFVRHFFKKEGKDTMLEMVANIRHQFMEVLKTVDWMDETTRRHALDKANAMKTYIAFPDELLDDEKIGEYYKNLTLDPHKYLESAQNISLFQRNLQFLEMVEPLAKSDWRNHLDAAATNAYYNDNDNSIEFPAGILQGAFFDNDRPQYMNYGAIGYIIGHEITHGFDDEGRQFDKNGNLVDWWQAKTKSAFDEKARCIINQYSNFTIPEINIQLNGLNTQGENIADNGGVKQAYWAYKKWTSEHGNEQKLPGLSYTPEQLFWISAGNTWCSVQRNEQLKMDVLGEYHSPSYYRVNVPLMNSKEFAKDFDCPAGSNMDPENKCVVW